MKMWVDADACPRDAKDIVFRTAMRLKVHTILVANSPLQTPRSEWIAVEVVAKGLDIADDYIADHVVDGDLVITSDIPLAARVVDRGAAGIDPRGQLFTEDNVKEKLATRNLMTSLRDGGMIGGGPPPYKPKDKSKFASSLDQLVTRLMKQGA